MIRFAVLLVSMLAAFAAVGRADQTDPRLPNLFDRLSTTADLTDAEVAAVEIWQIWSETGDSELDHMFAAGSRAMAMGDLVTALGVFNEMTRKAPNFAEGWNKRATVHYLMGHFEESLADIDRTLALEPRHFGALAGLGLVNLELDRDEAALDAFERVLRVYPLNHNAKANAEYVRQRIKEKSI